MFKNLQLIFSILLGGLEAVSAVQYYEAPIPFFLDLNFNNSPTIKQLAVKIRSSDKGSLLLDMSGAELPRDERIERPEKHSNAVPTSWVSPENVYRKVAKNGFKLVPWENLNDQYIKFKVNELEFPYLSTSIQMPLALYNPAIDLNNNCKNNVGTLFIDVKIDEKEDVNSFPLHYLGKTLKINIRDGSVKDILSKEG